MTKRVHNFNPGPAALPLEVLQQAQAELLDYKGTGMSVMEISHRSKDFEAIVTEAQNDLRDLLTSPPTTRFSSSRVAPACTLRWCR